MYMSGEGNNTNQESEREMRISLPLKDIVLTAIKFKGIEAVKKEAQQIADDCFAKKQSVMAWIRKVEKGEVVIN